MEQIVRVRSICGNGMAEVIHIRQSACSGDCHKCSGCGAAQETLILQADNPIGARPGDLVVISSDTAQVLGAAATVYLIPLVLFFAGFGVGSALGISGPLVGCLGFAAGIAAAVLLDRHRAKHEKNVYTITGFAPEYRVETGEKGDNDLG